MPSAQDIIALVIQAIGGAAASKAVHQGTNPKDRSVKLAYGNIVRWRLPIRWELAVLDETHETPLNARI